VLREGNNWLDANLERCIDNGERSLFWYDKWVGGVRLSEVFPRLLSIAVADNSWVCENGERVGTNWLWGPLWRRNFFSV
jgi:hypothetical protein